MSAVTAKQIKKLLGTYEPVYVEIVATLAALPVQGVAGKEAAEDALRLFKRLHSIYDALAKDETEVAK